MEAMCSVIYAQKARCKRVFLSSAHFRIQPLTNGYGVGILLTGISRKRNEVKKMEQQRPQQVMVLVTVVTVNGTRYHVYREERNGESQALTARSYSCPCCGNLAKQEYIFCGRCLA